MQGALFCVHSCQTIDVDEKEDVLWRRWPSASEPYDLWEENAGNVRHSTEDCAQAQLRGTCGCPALQPDITALQPDITLTSTASK